jgi:hypothetical protein
MNIDPTTSTVIEKREHTCLIFSDFQHRFQKPKSHSRGCAKLGGRKERPKKRVALSIFEAEMLSQSVSHDFLPTITRKVIYCRIYARVTLFKVRPLT